jgi:hypothetical protein
MLLFTGVGRGLVMSEGEEAEGELGGSWDDLLDLKLDEVVARDGDVFASWLIREENFTNCPGTELEEML